MIFTNRHLVLITLLLTFCFSNIVHAGETIKKSVLFPSSMKIHLNEISGWNHLETDIDVQKNIKNTPTDYKIVTTKIINKNKSSLNISTILVRKIANWHQQHSNGIKINLVERDLTFGQFIGFNFAITINHLNSVRPNIKQAQDYYVEEIKTGNIKLQWLNELLREPPVLTFTLFGQKHDNQEVSTPIATFSYKIVPSDDKNIVNFSSDYFSYYWQQDYQEQKVNQTLFANEKIYGMLITLDTSTNRTLRSFMANDYQQNFPKTIKELFLEQAIIIENPIINMSLSKVNDK